MGGTVEGGCRGAARNTRRTGSASRPVPRDRAQRRTGRPRQAREIRLALVALLAEGHLLIEDVPGVGKTMLAKAIARSIDCSFRRIQFTPDLLPTDITGVNVFNQEHGDFEFKPGADLREHRARRRDQPGLAEDPVGPARMHGGAPGDGRHRDAPARHARSWSSPRRTPIEHEGTYPLPEAQLDRFMLRLSIGYPTADVEAEILPTHGVRPAARRHRSRSPTRPASPTMIADGPRACTSLPRSGATSSTSSRPPGATPTCSSAPALAPRSCSCAPPGRWPPPTSATT